MHRPSDWRRWITSMERCHHFGIKTCSKHLVGNNPKWYDGATHDPKTYVGVNIDPRTCLIWVLTGPVIRVKMHFYKPEWILRGNVQDHIDCFIVFWLQTGIIIWCFGDKKRIHLRGIFFLMSVCFYLWWTMEIYSLSSSILP